MRRRGPLWAVILLGGVALTPFLFIGYIAVGFKFAGGNGSMAKARQLRPLVEAVTDPDSLPPDRNWAAVKCANGEWILGVSASSHDMYSEWFGGGTVVLKDSRGRVRCFLGHVCGRWDIELHDRSECATLDDIDATLANCRYAEQQWP